MFSSKKRGRAETVVDRRVTLPSKKSIRLTTAAVNRDIAAQYARSAPQFVFNAPQAPANNAMDIAEGERAAAMQDLGYSNSSLYTPSFVAGYSPASYRRLKRTAKNSAKAASSYRASLAKKASKASLARARTSMKKGGTAIPKATLRKAADKGTYIIHFRGLMKKSKNALIKAMNLEPKSVLAACLAKRYTK